MGGQRWSSGCPLSDAWLKVHNNNSSSSINNGSFISIWFFREWYTKMAHMIIARMPSALKNERRSCRDVIWLGQQYHNVAMLYHLYMGDKSYPSEHNNLRVIQAGVAYHITRRNTVLLGERARKQRVFGRPHIRYTPGRPKICFFQRLETHGWGQLPAITTMDDSWQHAL